MRLIDADAIKLYYGGLAHIPYDDFMGIANYFMNQIKEMPTVTSEPHWIPVTERLPETSDAVLTTYIVNGDRSNRYVEESSYYGDDGSWISPWDEYREAGTSIEVIAWMPMPEEYRGE